MLKNIPYLRPLVITFSLLIPPFFGNLFVDDWNWPWKAFAFFFTVLFSAGLAFEMAGKKSKKAIIIGFGIGELVAAGIIAYLEYSNPNDDVAGVVILSLLLFGILFAITGFLVQRFLLPKMQRPT